MKFEKRNINPKGNSAQDCVIRAIATATSQSWYEVFDGLCKIARDECYMIGDTKVLKEYLKEHKHKTCPAIKGQKRKKVKDFNNGTYVLRVSSHLTCVVEGVHIDNWDCKEKCVYRYWKIKGGGGNGNIYSKEQA